MMTSVVLIYAGATHVIKLSFANRPKKMKGLKVHAFVLVKNDCVNYTERDSRFILVDF